MTPDALLLTTANQSQAFLRQLTAELRQIRDVSLYNARAQERVEVVEQGSVSYGSLRDLLHSARGQTITMLHYIGHSSAQGLWVEQVSETGQLLSLADLADLLGSFGKLRFVFLNSCCSKTVAQALLRAGVPCVIGTSIRIRDEQAVRVAGKFYEILGDVFDPPTLGDAFGRTQTYFANDLTYLARPTDATRGAFATETDEDTDFPWQFYQRDDLTDTQRQWRLVPAVAMPAVIATCYTIKPTSAGRSLTFRLAHSTEVQPLADSFIDAIRRAFEWYGELTEIPDEPATNFVFLLVNDTFLHESVGASIVEQSRVQYESNGLWSPPVVLLAGRCAWRSAVPASFNSFPLSGEPLEPASLTRFAQDFYAQCIRLLRQRR